MANSPKPEIITFKADASLTKAMRGITNRSSFIRDAILAALENVCPLCRGTGVLTTSQRKHWAAFASDHTVAQCDQCHAFHLTCENNADKTESAHSTSSDAREE